MKLLSHRKNRILLLLGLAIGGTSAWLVFSHTDLSAVLTILRHHVDYALMTLAVLSYGGFFFGKALRWRYLLEPVLKISALRLLPYVLLGYAGNVLLPFQAGEVGRGVLLSRHHAVSAAAVLSGIALEKLFDFLALLILLVWALTTLDTPSSLAEQLGFSLAGVLTLAGLGLLGLLIRPKTMMRAIDRLLSYGPAAIAARLSTTIHNAIDGLAALRRTSSIFKLVVTSLATWTVMLVTLDLTIGALQLEVPLSVLILVLALSAVGLALPTSPGFVGTLQAAFVLGMVPFAVAQEAAVAASLLYQFLTTLPPLAAGLVSLLYLRRLG